jgi:hypothetical protein
MTTQTLKSLSLTLLPLVVLAGRSSATQYDWNVDGDPSISTNWSPDATSIISGNTINPLPNDRLNIVGGNMNGGSIINIQAGSDLRQSATGQHRVSSVINIAGTGTDGNGAIQNHGNDWINTQGVNVTADATVLVQSGGWRQQNHDGSGLNAFNLGTNNTLTVRGGNNWYFVDTAVTGTGVLDVQIGGEFNFEASSVLPAGMTMRLSGNTRSSSWDGAGRTMAGDVYVVDSAILENRTTEVRPTLAPSPSAPPPTTSSLCG